MKRLSVTPISDSAQMPLKKGTLQFLQDANLEALSAILRSHIGDAYNLNTVYVLFGVKNSGTAPNYIISAGAVFYQGEIFLVDATSFSTSGNTAIFQIITTQYTTYADPVTFSDSTVHNVHDIRKVQVLAGTAGTGIADFSQANTPLLVVPAQVSITGAGVTGSYPNFVIPGANGLHPILGAGTFNIGDIPAGGQTYSVSFADVGTANYYIQMSLVSNSPSNPQADANSTQPMIRTRSNTGFTFYIDEPANIAQNLILEYILFAK